MYKRKEYFILVILIIIILGWNISIQLRKKEVLPKEEFNSSREFFTIQIEGEVVRPMELQYIKPVSFGVLFLRIENCLNEFSDLSNFNLNEMISSSRAIYIPTYDIGNQYSPSERICINQASLMELKKLPQIGEKRAQKILDYIGLNGKIETWEIFFKIVGVPENVKDEIKNQAIL